MNSVVPTRTLGVLAVALTAAAGQAQVYSSSPAVAIPAIGTIQDSIVVAGAPTITDLNLILNITHSYDGDLDVILVPPAGNVYIHLTSDNGGSGDNYQVTRFDQQALASITTGAAPFVGTFLPEGGDVDWRAGATIALPGASLADLSALNGSSANGTWTLIIDDDTGGDFGTLNYWSLEVNGAEDPNGPSAPPSAVASVAPGEIIAGDDVLFTVTTQVGSNPAAAISSVTLDLSPVGGSSTEALFDDATNGDTTANDGVYSLAYTVAASSMRGDFALEYTVTDAASRTATGTVTLDVEAIPGDGVFSEVYPVLVDAGDMISTAAATPGEGALNAIYASLDANDTDIFAINICDPANFSATTNPLVEGGTADTQLFLFDSAGIGITHDDDIPDGQPGDDTGLSRLGSDFVSALAPGVYYLAVTSYNRDPVDAGGALIWTNTPFNTERAPGGPGAANPLAGWTGTTAATGRYTINLTGTCFGEGGGSSCPSCAADYDQDGGVGGSDVAAFFADFEQGATCADVDQDGGISGADVAAFFGVFEAGGC